MSSLIHCIYTSAAARPLGTTELAALLQSARARNQALGVTGMLLYAEEGFFQILEGPSDAVDAIFEKLAQDTRHDQVTRIIREPIAKRTFGDWTMGFSQASHRQLAQWTGTNDFFQDRNCLAKLDAGRAKKLLAAFGDGRWRRPLARPH